jgi:hypothetical protein
VSPPPVDMQQDARSRFEALALPRLGYLYRLAVRLNGGAQDAEDLVQETYIRALRAFATLRDPTRIRPWLCPRPTPSGEVCSFRRVARLGTEALLRPASIDDSSTSGDQAR